MTNARVAVIVLHWNNYADTRDCLESLRVATYRDLLTVVVDNASSNDSLQRLRAEFPECHFVMNLANYGFAKGNNQGIRYALEQGADYVLLLNNDTIVAPDFLEPLVQTAETGLQVGALSGKIYWMEQNGKLSERLYYAGGDLSYWRGTGVSRYYNELDKGQADTIQEVTFVSGCCMLIPRHVLDDVGLLDERFFFGVEDVDYAWRLLKHNYKMYYVPEAKIWHKKSASRSFTPNEFYHGYISKCSLMKKHRSPVGWWLWYTVFLLRTLMILPGLVKGLSQQHQLPAENEYLIRQAIFSALRAAGRGDFRSPMEPES